MSNLQHLRGLAVVAGLGLVSCGWDTAVGGVGAGDSPSPSNVASNTLPPAADRPFVSETPTSAPATTVPHRARSENPWLRRVVADWLHRGNRSEPSRNFFDRLRQDQQRASDSLLVSRCRSLLLADPQLRSHFIHVSARDGVVELKGTVPTEEFVANAVAVARRTPGARDVRQAMSIATGSAIQQATFVGAALASPVRLDGRDLDSRSLESGVAAAMPTVSESLSTSRPAATLGGTIDWASPVGSIAVRSYTIDRLMEEPVLDVTALPPVRHQTVAKTPTGPTVLPSGQRVWADGVRRPTIPAPPRNAAAGAKPAVLPVTPTKVSGTDALADQCVRDVAALLAGDPRAAGLIHEVRGREVRLSGSVASSSELFAISELVNSLPGIDFVSFGSVEFSGR